MNRIIVDYDQAHLWGLPSPIPSGQSQFSKILFQFSEEWKGLTKIAQFQDSAGKVYNVNFSEDACFCPSELVPGFLLVRVKGYPSNSDSPVIATANEVRLLVTRGFQSGGQPPVPPTPDLYQKLIEQFRTEATVPLATYEVPGKVAPSAADFTVSETGVLALGVHIKPVSALPETPDPDTLYLVVPWEEPVADGDTLAVSQVYRARESGEYLGVE